MESKRPTRWEGRQRVAPMPPAPRLCLEPGCAEADRALAEAACRGCVPGGCALAIGWEPGREPEERR